GVGPLASDKAARWIRDNVPGVHIPDVVVDRLAGAENPGREGKQICVDLIRQIREIPGIAGVHVMAYRQEHLVTEIIMESGVLKNRIINPKSAEQDEQPTAVGTPL
ncbi:MAG: methylenetetrahydrofolate reductase, partial [Hyphomicrobiales bacterium]|nr:methylenetetrahydrofolate reductase [Hyphomicrobiales bacterium]